MLSAGNVNAQVAEVCDKLEGMKELKQGFNMIGFSQGGQFLRVRPHKLAADGVAESCMGGAWGEQRRSSGQLQHGQTDTLHKPDVPRSLSYVSCSCQSILV